MTNPYGGTLIDREVPDLELLDRVTAAKGNGILLSHDDRINLTNLASGFYSPLDGFMTEETYRNTLEHNKLPSGLDWTVPIVLPIPDVVAGNLSCGDSLSLLNLKKEPISVIDVESIFTVHPQEYCQAVFGTESRKHPGVQDIFSKKHTCVGGTIYIGESSIEPFRYFKKPNEIRKLLDVNGNKTCVAFSTRNMCHLGHEYLHNIALETADLLCINVITGAQIKGSALHDVVFDTYEYLIENIYPEGRVILNNLQLPPIYGGPKEAFLQATVLQNAGFTHFIVGRDHAGIGDFYPKYGSQQIFEKLTELDISIIAISEPRFCRVCDKITTERGCQHSGDAVKALKGQDVRRYLLEKQYDQLESVFRPELRDFVVRLFEDKVDFHTDKINVQPGRQIFYD